MLMIKLISPGEIIKPFTDVNVDNVDDKADLTW